MSISRARAIAFDILRRVEAEGAYATDLLHAELAESHERVPPGAPPKQIKPGDAALATELTLGVLRWQRLLDFLLERHLKKPAAKLDLPVALALRLGLYQIEFLERIPSRAAVNESVELVKRARKASAASLVNAVLRRAAEDARTFSFTRESRALLSPKSPVGAASKTANPGKSLASLSVDNRLTALPPAVRLGILHSHPTWLVERWLVRFGQERTLALLEANNRPPRLSCALNDIDHRDEIIASLAKSGLRVRPGALLKNAFTAGGASVARTAAFVRGAISIQDEASQTIPLLLDVQTGDRVLDLCAAPGGKTLSLVRAAGPAGLVIAADRHAHRLRATRAQFERLRIETRFGSRAALAEAGGQSVAIVELDAEQPLPFRAPFDRILVDAPCSGTGTLARHPEIRWRLKPGRLAEFHRLQVAILTSALEALAPGGRLVYSTCSIEPEENEDVVSGVLSRLKHTQLVPKTETALALAPHLTSGIDPATFVDASGYFRTVPGANPTDGFFAAALKKDEN